MAIASGAQPAQMHPQAMPHAAFARPTRRRTRLSPLPFSLGAAILVLAGVVTQLVALLATTWWQATVDGNQVRLGFSDFGSRSWRGFAYVYFTWGAWLIVGLTLGLGAASCIRWRGAKAFRPVGAVVGVAAAVCPIVALLVFAYQSGEPFHVVRDYGIGAYLAVLGAMATALGAAAGPGR